MRPLEESEIQQVFEKLFKFVGKNLKNIVDRADQPHCFRLHKKVRTADSPSIVPCTRVRTWGASSFFFLVGGFFPRRACVGDDEISALPTGFGR